MDKENCFDPGTGNGQYTSLASCQNNCITPSWDCDGQGNCFDPGTEMVNTVAWLLQNNCITPSWDCDGHETVLILELKWSIQ